MELIAQRVFDPVYIIFDCIFLVFLMGLLLWKKKYPEVIVGLLAGGLYMAVDYGIFHLLCHSRQISDGYSLFWVLLWMSVSYGFTNFVWIRLMLAKDKDWKEWTTLILGWWFCCPLLAQTFGGKLPPVVIQRTTGSYHGYMAIILFVGYAGVIIWNLAHPKKEEKIPIMRLLAIGIGVQFGWEAALLLGGVRSAMLADMAAKMRPLIINSLLETNLGLPYLYAIHIWYTSRYDERMKKKAKPMTFLESVRMNNAL